MKPDFDICKLYYANYNVEALYLMQMEIIWRERERDAIF